MVPSRGRRVGDGAPLLMFRHDTLPRSRFCAPRGPHAVRQPLGNPPRTAPNRGIARCRASPKPRIARWVALRCSFIRSFSPAAHRRLPAVVMSQPAHTLPVPDTAATAPRTRSSPCSLIGRRSGPRYRRPRSVQVTAAGAEIRWGRKSIRDIDRLVPGGKDERGRTVRTGEGCIGIAHGGFPRGDRFRASYPDRELVRTTITSALTPVTSPPGTVVVCPPIPSMPPP